MSLKQLPVLKVMFICCWRTGKTGKKKLIQFSRLESSTRPFLKKLLEGLDKCEELPYPHGM